MILEANSYVLESLRTYYKGLLNNNDFGIRDLCREEILSFCSKIDNMIQNSRMEIARAKVLIQVASARRDLVSNILDCLILSYTYVATGSPIYPEPGHRKDGTINHKYASNGRLVSKRSSRNANSYRGHPDLPARNICICKSFTISHIIASC